MYAAMLAEALRHDGLRVMDFAVSPCAFLELAARHSPDVVIVSGIQGEDPKGGLTTLREFHHAHPHIPAIVLLDSSRREEVLEAFRSGATGIFSKHETIETLCKCVRVVYEGQVWANALELTFALDALVSTTSIRTVNARGINLLTRREHEVVCHVAEGLTNREIGTSLGLSPHTIKNYVFRIFDKLEVANRVELLRLTLHQPGLVRRLPTVRLVPGDATEDFSSFLPESSGSVKIGWKSP
jgi:two-component system nitrate/nitrite response regulator NarL